MRKDISSDILFLSETKNPDDFVLRKLNSVDYPNHLLVPPEGHGSGGLALFWKAAVDLSVTTACKNYIDVKISYENKEFFATFIYGDTDNLKRKKLWEELTCLSTVRDSPWFLTGDFNDIIGNQEKSGGVIRPEGSFVDFRSFFSACDLFDLPHSDDYLSWRGVIGDQVVRCRLDRALANSHWFTTFFAVRSEYLKFAGSDHKPVVTCFDATKRKSKGIFRFDRRLKDNHEVKELIKETWTSSPSEAVESRIINVRKALITWCKNQHLNSRKATEKHKEDLEAAMVNPNNNSDLISKINKDLTNAYLNEEAFWKQSSRNLWLSLGDKNSGFFHAVTKGRQAINTMIVMENGAGLVFFKDDDITDCVVQYYESLFKSVRGDREHIVNAAISAKVTDQANDHLTKLPSSEEIFTALMAIHPDKALGSDGFSTTFFHSNWSTVSKEIVSEIQLFFSTGVLPRNINETHVRLIPKTSSAKTVSDYRPIALCNVYYKIISKLLSMRLQPILHGLNSENQSAFVKGRAIADNVLISHEALQFLKTLTASKQCSMAVKTDMSKAFDRLEWDFIRTVLVKLGFCHHLVLLLMQCITTVSYSYLINGSVRGKVLPERGIRQGDPLSRYIFILCTEVFSGLCQQAERDGKLQGIRVAAKP